MDTNRVVKTDKFFAPIERNKKGEYKIKSGETVYLCFSSDFLIEDADPWRDECWAMIKERSDLHFVFLTKRIERFLVCVPEDWQDGYENVTVGCTVENQNRADERLSIFSKLPIQHKNIICQPLIERVVLKPFLSGVELVVVGGESDIHARPLDYEWVLAIREECVMQGVRFEFRQCGTYFIKGDKKYKLNVNQLCAQAKKANINC
jgi:protein gp37